MITGRGYLAVRIVRVGYGALTAVALVLNLINALPVPGFRVSNYFSYFTVLSNVFAAVVLLVGGLVDPESPRWQFVRGAATLCMTVTGVVYAALLANEPLGIVKPWINDVLHLFGPLLLLLDWLLNPPRSRLGYRAAASWLLIPLVYFGYTLIRGPLVGHWYPYPFVNPTRPGGYGLVILTCIVVGIGIAGIAFLLVLAVNAVGSRTRRPPVSLVGSRR